MWHKMPPQLSQRILAIIINDSLAILASRYAKVLSLPTELRRASCSHILKICTNYTFLYYCNAFTRVMFCNFSQIKPTEGSNQQFVCDILNTLSTVEELLFYVCTDMASVCGQADPSTSKVLFSIHLKCHCLASSLLVVGCPLEVLYKVKKLLNFEKEGFLKLYATMTTVYFNHQFLISSTCL